MEVIAMRGVVFRAEHGLEPFAGAALDDAQELPLGRRSLVPVFEHAHPAAIGEDERRNVDRLGLGVRGAPRTAGDVAASVAAHRLDLHDGAAEIYARGAV